MATVYPPWPTWLDVWAEPWMFRIHTRIKTEFSNWTCTFDTQYITRDEILNECVDAYYDICKRDAIIRAVTKRLKE